MSAPPLHCLAVGLATTNSKNEIIEVWYPVLRMNPSPQLAALLTDSPGWKPGANAHRELDTGAAQTLLEALADSGPADSAQWLQDLARCPGPLVACLLTRDTAPRSIAEAWLKLHLLSHRLARPRSLNLDGLFGILKNLAWTSEGPIEAVDLPARQLQARMAGRQLHVHAVDKFPPMAGYVVPPGVRIADAARVRLGAYLSAGTTVMHEGFINFNAGTLGAAMIEGRVSAGVTVGENSDLGGSASTMGTLSGGGSEAVSVGRNCLLGANAGIGFPLADGCIVEAGLYVTAGMVVTLLDADGKPVGTARARELRDRPNLLFRRNSLSGAVEALPLTRTATLNQQLHSTN